MKNYIELALNTEPASEQYREKISPRFENLEIIRLTHAAMGLVTESAEFLDVLKKHTIYGKDIDFVNLAEETGDIFWYLAVAIDALAKILDIDPVSLENQIKETNISKLKARYPNKFTENSAIYRDLGTERDILDTIDNKKMVRYGCSCYESDCNCTCE
jgi:NTP pyrophosphatase (non-canonical NTP hydrolase)